MSIFDSFRCVLVFAGERVVPLVWCGCLAALAGGVLMGASGGSSPSGELVGVASGDLLLVGAAIMWSIQVHWHLRLQRIYIEPNIL